MKDQIKEKLTLTRVLRNGDTIAGYQHRLTRNDIEYSVLSRLKEGETLSLSNDIIERYFEKDFERVFEECNKFIGFKDLKETSKIKMIVRLWNS